jgi:hypothetical protein
VGRLDLSAQDMQRAASVAATEAIREDLTTMYKPTAACRSRTGGAI